MRRFSLKIGLFRHKGVIYTVEPVLDTFRDPVSNETRAKFVDFWCRELPREGFEFQKFGGLEAQAFTVWEGHYVAGVLPSMVLVVDSVDYDIVSVIPTNNRDTLRLVCRRRY